jgi:alpha-L-fucosidase 2
LIKLPEIQLLQALPADWQQGYIHGICAHGGFDLDWGNGKLKQVKILSKLDNSCQIRYGAEVITLKPKKEKLIA